MMWERIYLISKLISRALKTLPFHSGSNQDSVSQIGIELHTGRTALGVNSANLVQSYSNILTFIRDLHSLGFKLISHVNNDCVEKSDDINNKYFSLMEVVFYKDV